MKPFSGIIIALTTAQLMHAAPRFEATLTSAQRNIQTHAWELPADQARNGCSIKKTILHGGKQEGVELIAINNGKLEIVLSPTRGMSVIRAQLGPVRLGWDSPVQEIVHPQWINLQSRGGLGWLEGFNELIVRCGLEFAGHPGKDKFINNVGDEAEMDLTLHGKIGNIAASEVQVIVEPDGLIRVRGRVDERMFYGPKLELWTEISTMPGSDTFTLVDEITNHGAHDQEMQLIYHANFGPTLLEKDSRFVGAIQRVAPFNDNAARAAKSYDTYAAPTLGFIEQVYCLFPYSGEDGRSAVLLHNAAGDQGVTLEFSTRELPYFTLWKNTSALAEGYVTGLEPGTGFPFNRRIERAAGRLPKLKPGEKRTFTLRFSAHENAQGVDSSRQKISALQAGRPTAIDSQPLPRPE